uniref:Uncharacterized protein n=1 Tax=Lactuca sativa TaxID=4236 RepID=A0A9R1UXZ6_LACSA|nr:hypothetical protein LSAT_V11C700384650 [Lactuca sativa]
MLFGFKSLNNYMVKPEDLINLNVLGVVAVHGLEFLLHVFGFMEKVWRGLWEMEGILFFWKETWMGDSTLDKHCTIENRMKDGGLRWNWRRPLRGGIEMLQYTRLLDYLSKVTLNDKSDSWVGRLVMMASLH